MEPTELTIEYEEQTIGPDEQLHVTAESADNVRILDVTQIGPDLRYRYAVIWENGTAPNDGDGS